MSDETPPTTPTNTLDLSSLRLMPAWVSDLGSSTAATTAHKYADVEDDPRRGRDRDRGPGGRRPGAGGGPGGERRGGFGGDRPRGDRDRKGSGPGAGPRGRGDFRGAAAPRVDDRPQLPTGLKVTVEPEDKALEMLAHHVKSQGRAFSLFDAARLVLAGPERHRVKVECEAERLVGLFQVPTDGSLFETREEAVRHLLKNTGALADLYRVDEVELEEPKGVFTSIGVCGMSGEVLGPPSHHSFQTALKRLHNERFSHLPFEDYRRRVRTETTPEIVEKWKEQQRKGTRWTYLKDEPAEGAEPLSFTSRSEFEGHFRRHHADNAVVETREAVVHATVSREQLSSGLGRLLRRNIEDAKKHLFEISQKIAHGLERRGLKLFKRRSGKMFVSRVKPRAIDPGVVLSERIAAIVAVIKEAPGIELPKLLEKLAPHQPAAEAPAPAATPEPAATAEAPAEGEAEAAAPAPAEKQPQAHAATDEQMAVLRDLHWLADAGYIIIYSDSVVYLGVQGEPPHHAPGAEAKEQSGGEESEVSAESEAEAATESEQAAEASDPAEAETPVEAETHAEPAADVEAEAAPVVEEAAAEVAEPEAPAAGAEVEAPAEEAAPEAAVEEEPAAGSQAQSETQAEAESESADQPVTEDAQVKE